MDFSDWKSIMSAVGFDTVAMLDYSNERLRS